MCYNIRTGFSDTERHFISVQYALPLLVRQEVVPKVVPQSQIAQLFFSFLCRDMKERACHPSTHLSCPKEPGVFLEQHLPPSFFCHKI